MIDSKLSAGARYLVPGQCFEFPLSESSGSDGMSVFCDGDKATEAELNL